MKRVNDFFTQTEKRRIEDAVRQAELMTSGEIRVVVRCQCKKGLSSKDQAIADFYGHHLDRTRDKTGILILIVLDKKKVEILGDKGINEKVPDGYWKGVVEMIIDGFKKGNRCESVCGAIVEMGNLLKEKFPRKPDDVNEIPDEVIQQ